MIALYPGAFKPPHRGHFNVVKSLLDGSYSGAIYDKDNYKEKGEDLLGGTNGEKPSIDKVIVFVGAGERNGITKDESMAIWNIYAKHLGNVEIVDGQKNPMFAAKDYAVANKETPFVAITGIRGDADFVDLKRITTFKNAPNVSGLAFSAAPDSKIRATDFRNSILSGNLDKIADFFPPELDREDILLILTDLKDKIVAEIIRDSIGGYMNEYFNVNENLEGTEEADIEDATGDKRPQYTEIIGSILEYMLDQKMNITPLPEVKIRYDEDNAKDFFGRTAHYDPNKKEVVVYATGRHPKDICRSFTHEMIHHIQNIEGRLGNIQTSNTNEDEALLELEKEAYLLGNITFRNWEDGIKNPTTEAKKPGLWANINAKKKRGEKPSHGNSNAHKDAKAAGKAMKKEGSGGADTAWEDDKGNKVTLQDILDMTKNIPIKDYPTEKLAKIVLDWDDNPEEVERIKQVEISKQYPILIMIDASGKIQWILDGNHRAQKALRSKAKTIPAKLIKPSNLDDNARRILLGTTDENFIDGKNEGLHQTEWPEKVPSRYNEVNFMLVKVSADRAKYVLLDPATNRDIEPGGRLFKTVRDLEAAAEDYILPKRGRQSSQFQEQVMAEGKYDSITTYLTNKSIEAVKNALQKKLHHYKEGHFGDPKTEEAAIAMKKVVDEVYPIAIIDVPDDIDKQFQKDINMEFDYELKAIFVKGIDSIMRNGGAYKGGHQKDDSWIQPKIELEFCLDPYNFPTEFEELSSQITDVLRHEIEHLTQAGGNANGKEFGADAQFKGQFGTKQEKTFRDKIANGIIKNGSAYLLIPSEIDANIQGLYLSAKKAKRPFKDVVDQYLYDFTERYDEKGNPFLTKQEVEDVKKKWALRLPSLGIKQEL